MKRYLSFLLLLALMASLVACGSGNGESIAPKPDEDVPAVAEPNTPRIEVKGTFLLEPSEQLDLSGEGLDSVQRYLMVVYDVLSHESENEQLSSRDDSITITMNGTNTYSQLSMYKGKVLQNFLENCGYAVSTTYGTLWGGSEPVRMMAAFAINGNDIKDDCTAKVEFELSDNVNASVDIARTDIQIINWMDGVFAVEEHPDAYQIARSAGVRAQICKNLLENASQANHDRQIAMRDVHLASLQVILAEDAVWGVSCSSAVGNMISSEELPTFKVDSVRIYYPEIADKIVTVSDCIEIITTGLDQENPDYDNINSAQSLAYDTLIEIIDYFDDK